MQYLKTSIAFLTIGLAVFCGSGLRAQQTAVVETIPPARLNELIPDSVRKALRITMPVRSLYRYSDKSGMYLTLLSESRDRPAAADEAQSLKLRAVTVTIVNQNFTKYWELSDQTLAAPAEEVSIAFWPEYIGFGDLDKDGLADPVIVYGTRASNGYDDGRVRILIYRNGKKVAIRHQNGVLDFERETQVDAAFYQLPAAIQAAVRQKMAAMMRDGVAIFPAGWEGAMKQKKRLINER